jgi:hypothetical protein
MSFMSGKKAGYTIHDYGLWNPMQKQLGGTTLEYLNNILKGNVPKYTGDYTAPLTSGEQDMISRNARLSALAETGLQPLLKGEFPEDYYQQSIYKPMLKQYQEDIQPLIEEEYAGQGYWGSARANAVAKGYRDLYDTLASKRAELGYQAMRDVPTAINAANALSTTEGNIQQIPRLIKQYGLDQQYKEFMRQQNVSQEAANQALKFLDISTVLPEFKEGEAGNWGMIANIAGLALAPFTGGASLIAAPLLAQGIDAATSPTGQGGLGSQMSGAAAGLGSTVGFGSSFGNLNALRSGSGFTPTTPGYQAGYKLSPSEMAKINQGNYGRIAALR